jgi:hypothetical protein
MLFSIFTVLSTGRHATSKEFTAEIIPSVFASLLGDLQGQQLTWEDTPEAATDSSSEEAMESRGENAVDTSLQAPALGDKHGFHSRGKVLIRLWLRLDMLMALSMSTFKNVFFTVTAIV